ncbi:MAG: (4Fe-4S)-binding protein [Candidatus Aramenus sp.]|nr:(4Fe-4S)-binding protein [Candidatus Aramenus sp.]
MVSKKVREYLGDDLLREVFEEGGLAYIAEFGDYLVNDLRDNGVQSLVVASERENKELEDFLERIDDFTPIHPLSVERVYLDWFQGKEHGKALLLAYVSKASMSYLAKRVQPLRRKSISRRSLVRGKLYYYKPYPVLQQEVQFEREMNYLSSLCPLIEKSFEGPHVSDPEKCSACGFCSGMSFLGYLEVPNFTTDQVVHFLNALNKYAPRDKPSIVLFTCNKALKVPRTDSAYVYPLIAPCVASVHDSFLALTYASGFYPLVYSPDRACELRDVAKLRMEASMRKFPGTKVSFPFAQDEAEAKDWMEKLSRMPVLPGKQVPEELVMGRSRRRGLLLWAIKETTVEDEEEEVPGVYKVAVDPNKCVLCGVCVRSCQMLVFEQVSTRDSTTLYYDLSYCIGSQRCIRNCPEKAITLVGLSRIKDLKKSVASSSQVVRCRYCGKPLDSYSLKNRVSIVLSSLGIDDVEDYTDVCNDCKQKLLTKRWVERVLKNGLRVNTR